jgi:hypothetical protein
MEEGEGEGFVPPLSNAKCIQEETLCFNEEFSLIIIVPAPICCPADCSSRIYIFERLHARFFQACIYLGLYTSSLYRQLKEIPKQAQ